LKDNVDKIIHKVGLDGYADHYPYQVSGGMQQRASLARALIGRPKILLLDEPLGALDAFTRMTMQDEIHRVWEDSHTTMIMVTHDIEEAYSSGRVIVLSDGAIIGDGEPKKLFKDEEILKKAKLGVPFLLQAKKAFHERGLDIPDEVDSLQKLEDFLW